VGTGDIQMTVQEPLPPDELLDVTASSASSVRAFVKKCVLNHKWDLDRIKTWLSSSSSSRGGRLGLLEENYVNYKFFKYSVLGALDEVTVLTKSCTDDLQLLRQVISTKTLENLLLLLKHEAGDCEQHHLGSLATGLLKLLLKDEDARHILNTLKLHIGQLVESRVGLIQEKSDGIPDLFGKLKNFLLEYNCPRNPKEFGLTEFTTGKITFESLLSKIVNFVIIENHPITSHQLNQILNDSLHKRLVSLKKCAKDMQGVKMQPGASFGQKLTAIVDSVESNFLIAATGSILEVKGYKLSLSECLEKVQTNASFQGREIQEVRFLVGEVFFIDCSLKKDRWHGINISVIAKSVEIIGKQVNNLISTKFGDEISELTLLKRITCV
jgi:hypothetical protein